MDQQNQPYDYNQPEPHQVPGSGAQYAPPSLPPTDPQHPTVRRRTAIFIGIGALILGAGIGAAGKNNKTTDTSSTAAASSPKAATTVTATATQTVSAPAPAAVTVTAKAAAAPAASTVTVTAAAPTSAAPAGIGDGTYVVGTDIKPGLYKTTGAADSSFPNCYWERDRDLSGGMGSIIANDNPTGPTTVQISSSDKAFKTSGCAPWVKIG